MSNIPAQFRLSQSPIAKAKSVLKMGRLRITLLTSRLLRVEYSPNHQFEDRPSQAFWYRDQPTPEFTSGAEGDFFSLETKHLVLTYNIKHDTLDTLSIFIKENGHTWHFGDAPTGNLRGTYRTLDRADGAVELELGLVSREGWAVADDSRSLVFTPDGWLANRDESLTHDLYFFGHGSDFQGAIDDYFAISGRVPMIPRWALGNWWSRYWAYSDQELLNLMDEFNSHNIPLSVCIVDMDWHITDTGGKGSNWSSGWTGYTWNTALFPNPKGFIDQLHQRKLRTALNLHPHAGIEAHEAMYIQFGAWMNQDISKEAPVQFDIANARFAQGYFEILHHPQEDQNGLDFWWVDWQQEYESAELKGLDALWWLNHLHFYDLGRGNKKRPFIFSRWGGLGNHRYPIGFSGDTHTTWESLQFQPYFTATATNVGYSWWSHDIGGHMFGIEDGELYTRWVQYGVLSPILRLHSTKNHYSERRPWGWRSEEVAKVAGDAMRLRHALVPYIYSMAWRNHTQNVALINPMYYTHPHEDSAYIASHQYWFGSEMIVAPHIKPISDSAGVSQQAVWLPEGDWYDFNTGARYDGGGWVAVYGDLRHIPMLVKDGGIIPLAPITGENDTPLPQTVHLHRYGMADGQFTLYEDDGSSNAYVKGDYAQTTIQAVGDGAMQITAPTPKPYLPQNRAWVHHHHHQERDLRAECEALLWRFEMNTWIKNHLGDQLNAFIKDPFVLREFITYLTPDQIRALCDTAHGVGVYHINKHMGADEAYVLWNRKGHLDFTYTFNQVDGRSNIWGKNPLLSESGVVPKEHIIIPVQTVGEEYLIHTHHRLQVHYFGFVTITLEF